MLQGQLQRHRCGLASVPTDGAGPDTSLISRLQSVPGMQSLLTAEEEALGDGCFVGLLGDADGTAHQPLQTRRLLDELRRSGRWKREKDENGKQDRFTWYVGDGPSCVFGYSGISLSPEPWPANASRLRDWLPA